MMPGVPSIDTKFPLPSVTLPNGTDENGTAITYTVTHPTYLFFKLHRLAFAVPPSCRTGPSASLLKRHFADVFEFAIAAAAWSRKKRQAFFLQ